MVFGDLHEDYGVAGMQTASSEKSLLLDEKENWGMGYSKASLMDLPALARSVVAELSPYYSPRKNESEEHYYEIFSHVTMSSMKDIMDSHEPARTMVGNQSSRDRLEEAHRLMFEHARQLKVEIDRVRAKLLECGEECTDLW